MFLGGWGEQDAMLFVQALVPARIIWPNSLQLVPGMFRILLLHDLIPLHLHCVMNQVAL